MVTMVTMINVIIETVRVSMSVLHHSPIFPSEMILEDFLPDIYFLSLMNSVLCLRSCPVDS